MPLELLHGLLPSHGRVWWVLWRWFRHGFQLVSATGSVNWGLILASCGWMLYLESELKGESSFDGLLAEAGGKPMSSGSISLSLPRPCAYRSENLAIPCKPLGYLLPLWAILRRLAM